MATTLFGLSVSFYVCIGTVTMSPRTPHTTSRSHKTSVVPSAAATSEASLSPSTRDLQRQIRERARERLADAKSLRMLELTTAADWKPVKAGDKTTRMTSARALGKAKRHTAYPASAPTKLPVHRLQGLDGTPLSYAPSFSSPRSVEERYGTPNIEPDTHLSASGTSNLELERTTSELSESEQFQADEMHKRVDEVEQQAAQVAIQVKEDTTTATETPLASPTLQIKHLPTYAGSFAKAYTEVKQKLKDLKYKEAREQTGKAQDEEGVPGLVSVKGTDGPCEDEGWDVV